MVGRRLASAWQKLADYKLHVANNNWRETNNVDGQTTVTRSHRRQTDSCTNESSIFHFPHHINHDGDDHYDNDHDHGVIIFAPYHAITIAGAQPDTNPEKNDV